MPTEFEYHDNTKNALNIIGEDLKKKMTAAVNAVRTETLKTLSGQRSGRVYRVPGTGRTYTASAPGQPPAVATGNLKQHIDTKIVISENKIEGQVGTPVKYGPMLEYGTSKMLPRPWLRPSFEKSEDKIEEIFQKPIGWGVE